MRFNKNYHSKPSRFFKKSSSFHMLSLNQPEGDKNTSDYANKENGGLTMLTQSFRTKTIFIDRSNPSVENLWGIAIDVGYSGTKLFSPNCVACFPSFAAPVDGSLLNMSEPENSTILYRDGETGRIWKVGKSAQDNLSTQDPDQNSSAIYGRQRYFSAMYLVIARTALGIACRTNRYGKATEKEIYLETGLPNSYLRSDTPLIIEALSGEHAFELKIGAGNWEHFEITLYQDHIHVMAQPIGTLLSVSSDINGNTIPQLADYYKTAVAICDPGFGTMDCFSLVGGVMNRVETITECTMQKVLSETSDRIYKKYHVEIPVPAFQKFLENGYFQQFDRKIMRGNNVDFSQILEECNKKVALQTIDKLCELYNYLQEYTYLIVTGGTGEAWYPYFIEAFSGLPNLTLIPGNQNTQGMAIGYNGEEKALPFIFSNVRGYYVYLQHKLEKLAPKSV